MNHSNIKGIALPPCFPCALQVLHHYPFTFITFQHIIHYCYLQEYTSENIDWTRVDFEDNQECLDLIEKVGYSDWNCNVLFTSHCLFQISGHFGSSL